MSLFFAESTEIVVKRTITISEFSNRVQFVELSQRFAQAYFNNLITHINLKKIVQLV